MKLCILLVTHNHERTIQTVLERLPGVADGAEVLVWDNASSDTTRSILQSTRSTETFLSEENIGFCGANNRLITRALERGATHMLCLNPDALPFADALPHLLRAVESSDDIALATPKILRANEALEMLSPPILDAAGMIFTPSFRHFDRGSGEQDVGQYDDAAYVPGGTGAALLLKRASFETYAFRGPEGLEIFDERFFAYREDAELALRVMRCGLRTIYEPKSRFLHVRHVLPENRNALPARLNSLSVQNRFLLQQAHFERGAPLKVRAFTAFRNLLVRGACATIERSSREGLQTAERLGKESRYRRRYPLSPEQFWERIFTIEQINEQPQTNRDSES